MRFITPIILAITLFSSQAQAVPVGLDLVLVKGGVNRAQAIAMFNVAKAKLAKANVNVVINRLRIVPNSGPKVTLANWNLQFWYWARWAHFQGARTRKLTYVMLPPFYDNGIPYLGGMAEGVCSPKGYAVGNAEIVNHLGQSRFYHSAIIMAHEIGHLLGASHTKFMSLMNIGALGFSPVQSLSFAPISKAQIKRCLGV